MQNFKRRKNGTGSIVFLGNGRYQPYAARLMIGKKENGGPVYQDINTFETDLDALVCLENWLKEPFPIKVERAKYDTIVTFTCFPKTKEPYPLVPVDNVEASIHRKNKRNYTFKQVFKEMEKVLFPTKEEIKLELNQHIKPVGKFAYHNSSNMRSAYNNSRGLYDKIYSELKTSDFQEFINNSGKSESVIKSMIKLYRNMDKYAFQEDIIDKNYAQYITCSQTSVKSIREPFTYEQIEYLWSIKTDDEKEQTVRDILLLAIYTGCRAEEILFIFTKNIYFNPDYFIGGLKTDSGINREVPIHPRIKPILKTYYNPDNEFLFMQKNGNRLFYPTYNTWYQDFIKKHPLLKGKTAHCGRHTLETELQKLNVKLVIINSIIGHKNGNIGSDVYNHIKLEEKIEAMKLVSFKQGKIIVLNTQKKPS